MAGCNAVKGMDINEDISLREYLHLLAKRVKDPPCIDEYDEFLIEVWDFFSLRAAAENYYDKHRHVAKTRNGALPITWQKLKETWQTAGPPEQPITLIAKRNFNDLRVLAHNLRKVLSRVRQKVAIAHVQQVDAHCLRWLTRQPGYTAAEKGGARQEILGVVRVENYNTLENRVLKDFLKRCVGLATMYLRHYERKYPAHTNIKSVSRFKNLCLGCLTIDNFENIQDLHDFPQPNYVLQQDRLYSKVWTSYCDILRLEDVAERLWNQRECVHQLYTKCNECIPLHCSPYAKYSTYLWVNPIDGRKEVLEAPVWENELGDEIIYEPNPPQEDVQIINFTFPWDNRSTLIYPSSHPNARPFIQNPHRPSKESGKEVVLSEIVRTKDGAQLQDYFRQLYGLLGGSRWVVLVPDNWEAQWLEKVKRAYPPALSKNKLFLLWRSVAAALGMMEKQDFVCNESLVIADGYTVPTYNAIEIRFMREVETGRILPQRASARLHSNESPNVKDLRFVVNKSFSETKYVYNLATFDTERLGTGILSSCNFISNDPKLLYFNDDEILRTGVRRYLQEESEGLISYFDERETLSLVVQNRAEEIEFKTLVEHEECSPGGRPYSKKLEDSGVFLQQGHSNLSLFLLEGKSQDDAPLKELNVKLDQEMSKTIPISFDVQMTPGQGLASVACEADFLEEELFLDLTEMKNSSKTKASIEREMKRHFPPVMPYVEASEELWSNEIAFELNYYLMDKRYPRAETFAKARSYWGHGKDFDPERMSPIDILKRENVFGNHPKHRTPRNMKIDKGALFEKLAKDYNRTHNKDILRLIAWTYQYDAECFEPIRKSLYEYYVKWHGSLNPIEVSFCANNFAQGDSRVSEILARALDCIGKGGYEIDELRLAYNLMQFHPKSLESVDTGICNKAMRHLMDDYNTYPFWIKGKWQTGWGGKNETKVAGYYIKCMLFLLHRRRFDSNFFKCSETWSPSGFLNQALPPITLALQNHEQARIAFINYARGHGSIEGVPLGD